MRYSEPGIQKRKNVGGFTLIELLIVVAIIMIIAAIAVPNLLRSRESANEASAAESMRTIVSAEYMYAMHHPDQGYACDLASLAQDADIDAALASGLKSGYNISLQCPDPNVNGHSFFVVATPAKSGQNGAVSFCADASGTVREQQGDQCTAQSPPLKG